MILFYKETKRSFMIQTVTEKGGGKGEKGLDSIIAKRNLNFI